MTAHDDDRVIHLLREAVPGVPEVADRVTAVRNRAGRQRVQLWTQALGAAASVLMLVGVAAAVANPGASKPVRPAADPLRDLPETFAKQTSVAFELRTTPVGPTGGYPTGPYDGEPATAAESAELLASHATGAVSVDGYGRLDGDISVFGFFIGTEDEDFHVRLLPDSAYRSLSKRENAPAGKKWARSDASDSDVPEPAEIEQWLRMVTAFAQDVRYVRATEVRGVPVAEYVVLVPSRYTNGERVEVTIALDEDGLPRRLAAQASLTRLFQLDEMVGQIGYPGQSPQPAMEANVVRAELELFDYGKKVHVDVPPAAEVIDEDALMELEEARMNAARERLSACLQAAHDDAAAREKCGKEYQQSTGFPAGYLVEGDIGHIGPGECETTYDPEVGGEVRNCAVQPTRGSGDSLGGSGGAVLLPATPVPGGPPPTSDPRPGRVSESASPSPAP